MIAANDSDMQPLLAMTPDQLRLFIAHAAGLLAHLRGNREAAQTLRRISDRLEREPAPAREYFAAKASIAASTLEAVLSEVEAETGVTAKEIRSREKSRRVARARRLCMWRLREMKTAAGGPRYSYPEIGRAMGCDHSTVIYACREMRAAIDAEAAAEAVAA